MKYPKLNAFLNVVHVVKDSTTYANVASVMPLKKGMARMDAEKYLRVKDREPEAPGMPGHENLPPLTDDDIGF
jgi:hypothetical protein